MLAQRDERLGRTIGRRRQSVGAQADPGQKRRQRKRVIDRGVGQVARLADQDRFDPVAERLFFVRRGVRFDAQMLGGRIRQGFDLALSLGRGRQRSLRGAAVRLFL